RIRSAIGDLEFSPPSAEIEPVMLSGSLMELLDAVEDLASAAVLRAEKDAARELESLAARIESVAEDVENLGPGQREALGVFQASWVGGLHSLVEGLWGALEPKPLLAEDLPRSIRR